MRKSKKSQFLMLSAFVIMSIFVFIYSLETENSYIVNSAKTHIVDNIKHETCKIGYLTTSNTTLVTRTSSFASSVSSYCSALNYTCTLTSSNSTPVANFATYTHTIAIVAEGYNHSSSFSCS